jgi:hypothetical protein
MTTSRQSWLRTLAWSLLLVCCLVLAWSFIPCFVESNRSKPHLIAQNLMQLEGAVQQWALVHKRPDTAMVTKQDVAPYLQQLRHNGWVESVAGEIYTLRGVTDSPQAELTRELGGRPKGTIFRMGTNGALETILPNPQGRANGRQPFRSETKPTSGAAASRRSP